LSNYAIAVKPSARKELEALPDNVLTASFSRLNPSATRPVPHQWRIRVGDWRVLYIIDDVVKNVGITRIAHRREVYE
jgi:mRNA interferase RelE/StbE